MTRSCQNLPFFKVGTDKPQPRELYVAMTSDRGLAGAVHSNINKNIRARLEEKLANGETLDNVKILCVGDKSRAFFQRFFPKQILQVGSEIGRLPPTFNDAAKIANAILTSGYEYDTGKLLFNYYKSVVSNETTELPIYSQGNEILFLLCIDERNSNPSKRKFMIKYLAFVK